MHKEVILMPSLHLFDIVGPAMIGPSSSHTAGAVRIGQVVRNLLEQPVERAKIGLHGSFAMTYKGHGTDRALAGGLMGLSVDDPGIRSSLIASKKQGVIIEFERINIQGAHPNTVLINAQGGGRSVEIQASSIGGGSIVVSAIDGVDVDFSGDEHTLIVSHRDAPGVIASVSSVLAKHGINIAAMKVSRTAAGQKAIMVLELDALPDASAMSEIDGKEYTDKVTLLPKRI
ncbi:MAG: L-serine ammonia-lyase, iron-sulfur-dependent subunit beta [Christensenellales bacterium]